MGKTLSNDDTLVRDSNTSWTEVMEQMDAPIHKYCAVNNITDYMPYKIRAITASARASCAKEVSSITLEHANPEPWDQVLDLLQLNYTNGYKDITITIDSEWTVGGRAPPSPEPVPDTTLGPSCQQDKRTQRSIAQSAAYQENRGVFWNEIETFWNCQRPLHCPIKARHGIACWVHKGRHNEISYSIAPRWREAIEQEGGSIRHPPMSIRRLIKANDELAQQREARKQAEKAKAKASVPHQASPSVSQVFYIGSQGPPPPTPQEQAHTPRQKSTSPIPSELDNGEGWVAFWDSIKDAIQSTRPESWQAGLDRAMAALDADFRTLSMLFKATDTALEKVVPQTGLRLLIHTHLSKFISSHREGQVGPCRESNFGRTTPKKYSPARVNISSDDSNDNLESTDENELNSEPGGEQQDDTSDGLI
ncbi:hypothetical protein KCV03_g10210, partial [Aureobasidium melanogenum]